ncbi:dynein heavy chain 6, axonemal isoform X3, partial [Biomphalaria glabrata]
FYFLSNDKLLEILAQTRNPLAVQPHLRKCFDAIHRLEFAVVEGLPPEEEIQFTNDILSMIAPEGEKIGLGKGLKARGNVEDWLGKVEEAMFASIRRLCKKSIKDYETMSFLSWIMSNASQVVLTICQMMWTRDVTAILRDSRTVIRGMRDFEQRSFTELNLLAGAVRGELPKLARATLCALITINVHARDIISEMVKKQVSELLSFDWQKQLRYYWNMEVDNCVVCMSIAVYTYGYEYLGACPRLVITPLTDRCYLCLMGALQLDLGGAPAGPAGTGKTETTKDLAKALAIWCVVFNCSDSLDYKMMGGFFSGLAQSGAWCCFDEFNRINIEVLSVIAQQLITIRNAKVAKLNRFMFEGREIKLVHTCAAFITMNPGYAGRTELPDNLQALFRPISMMVPDYGLIAEVILYSEGFESSRTLAKKMVQMYKLCSEQLSQQDHYDFGMRAVKSVLVMAGSLKRQNPDKPEDVVLIRALRDSNLPKFLFNDAKLFQAILSDLFPGVNIPEHDSGQLKDEIMNIQLEMKLQVVDTQVVKVIQFLETMIVRHGVMLVGPTGGGKTIIYRILEKALPSLYNQGVQNEFYQPVHVYVMNPKSITMNELYGGVDKQTLEWKDGLMGLTVRFCVNDTTKDHQWIVCDGPVDALWIENMNTVLDDNKMLCLANSERIKFTPYIHMIFEVQDLAVASPATVSRCGMVYVDPDELKWLPFVKTWLDKWGKNMSPEAPAYLLKLFEIYVEDGLRFVSKKCTQTMNQVDISKINSFCKLLEAIFFYKLGQFDWSLESSKMFRFLCQIFVFCYLWALGGNLNDEYRDAFDLFIRQQFDENQDAKLPGTYPLWSYYIEVDSKRMDLWERLVSSFRFDKSISFFKMMVPTVDTARYGYFLERLLSVQKPVLFTGGTGKSVIVRDLLDRISERMNYVPVYINFSAQTSSGRIQEIIEGKLEKRKKNVIGAPQGKRVVIFIDDLNMPKPDTYGSQPPIELLRQYLDFDVKVGLPEVILSELYREFSAAKKDVTLAAACSPPGGGRNPVSPRLFRHFSMFTIPSPTEMSLKQMFLAIINGFLLDFSRNARTLAEPIVNSAVELYFRMSSDLLPTPAKSHYVFNLRDLSKVVQGILQADAGIFREKIQTVRLFIHETQRVFHDRLINNEDKLFFHKLMAEILYKTFNENFDPHSFIKDPLLFGNFMKMGCPPEEKFNEEISDMNKLQHVLGEYLDDLNLTSPKEMRLVFFMDALEHITRLVRMIQQERGNALLVGVGGTGKQSLTRLSAHMCNYRCFQIELFRGYDYSSFKLYIVVEEFLEDINNMLNSGEVPNLFEPDEYERLIIGCRPGAKEAGIPKGNRDAIYDYCIHCVRNNLHIVLCMSPVGSAFRSRCRMFPSLVNCCTIDWFIEWPKEALLGVAQSFFKTVSLGCSDEIKDNVSKMCVEIHMSVTEMSERFFTELKRRYYTTPTSYLELINLYITMVQEKTSNIKTARDRVANGLSKLFSTNDLVDNMKKELVALEPELKQKSADTAALMERLKIDQEKANVVQKQVAIDEAKAKTTAEETQAIADDAQRDLNEALPALEVAEKALLALDKNDIAEIRVFTKPPELVQTVLEAVAILLGNKTDWASCKAMLADTNFLKKIYEYDKENVPAAKLAKVRKYTSMPSFVPDVVAKVSKACKTLVLWVRAIDVYSASVAKQVEPKKQALAEAQDVLNEVLSVLKAKQDQLAEVEKQIKNLQAVFDKSMAEKKSLERNMAVTAARLKRSSKLTTALADEQVRWEESVAIFDVQLKNVVGDVFIAAACVAYYGAFTSTYRQKLVEGWTKRLIELQIPATENMTLVSVLADIYEIRQWNADGLPRDAVSIENAVLVTKGRRWPLMIDPQEQANRWIRNREALNNLKIIKLSNSNFLRTLEACIRAGLPVLMEDVGEALDPALEPVLLKQTFIQGGRVLIRLGDSDIDYDRNFRFYMTTKLSNPHYLPEVCIKVTVINFTVTKKGLEDQLLSDVVSLERPDLEEQRNELIMRINADKNQLKSIEDKILKLLFESEGNILDNEELINTLNDSKVTSTVIKQRLAESETTEEKISVAREKYRCVAERGSVMYFVVSDMGEVDPMYQFSLKYFKQLFNNTISTKIMKTEGEITPLEWNFFLRGPIGGIEKQNVPKPENTTWLPLNVWKMACEMSDTFEDFRYIHYDLDKTPVWIRLDEGPETTFAVTEFVSECLGKQFVESPPVTLPELYESMSKTTPLVFILSPGSDPMTSFLRFAKDMGVHENVKSISLGQGQGPVADKMIKNATKFGEWVFVQNCHLAASWMNAMEDIIKNIQETSSLLHSNFRLYLSSMPAKHFPICQLHFLKTTLWEWTGGRSFLAFVFFHAVILERKKFGPLGWNITYAFSDSDRECALLNMEMFCKDGYIPWETLIYITGEITYGGRVTDAQDQRCLRTILKFFFRPETLKPKYKYSESGIYYPPLVKTLATVKAYIESLPLIDEPDIFGLHENANIAFQLNEINALLATILDVQPRIVAADGGMSNDDITYELAEAVLDRLIDKLDIERANPNMFTPDAKGRINSLTIVLMQETERFNKLLIIIKTSLEQLKKAIKGFVVMSEELENVYNAFLNNHVPELWARNAYPSLKSLASWVKDLIMRCCFIDNWINNGPPKSFWLSGFFFPQGFLIGTLQNFARKYNQPIDHLSFKFILLPYSREEALVMEQLRTVKKGETIPMDQNLDVPDDGVLVHGLYMDGFAWDWDHMTVGDQLKGQMQAKTFY